MRTLAPKKQSKANKLQDDIILLLTINGFFAWRQNNVGVYDPVKKCYRKNPKQKKGVPDVCAIQPGGRFWGFEVKIGSDKLSEHQALFKQDCERNQAVYAEVKDMGDVFDALKKYMA